MLRCLALCSAVLSETVQVGGKSPVVSVSGLISTLRHQEERERERAPLSLGVGSEHCDPILLLCHCGAGDTPTQPCLMSHYLQNHSSIVPPSPNLTSPWIQTPTATATADPEPMKHRDVAFPEHLGLFHLPQKHSDCTCEVFEKDLFYTDPVTFFSCLTFLFMASVSSTVCMCKDGCSCSLKSIASAYVPQTCIHFKVQQGATLLLQKAVWLDRSLWENEPPALLMSELGKHFPDEFMVSVAGFRSDWKKHEVYFGNYYPIRVSKEQEVGEDLRQIYTSCYCMSEQCTWSSQSDPQLADHFILKHQNVEKAKLDFTSDHTWTSIFHIKSVV